MPLNDVSNAAPAAATVKTPYKSNAFAGFVIPGLTQPAPVASAKAGNGKPRGAAAKPRAVAATTTKKKAAPTAAKTKAAAAAAAAAPAAAEVAAEVQTPLVDYARTPGAGAGEGAGEDASLEEHTTPEQYHQYGDYGDAATPAPLVMGETPLAAYLAPEGTPYAYPAAYTPYDTEGRGGHDRGPATPYASAPTPEEEQEEDNDEAYDDEPTMLIPSIKTMHAAPETTPLQAQVEEEEEPPSPIPHAKHEASGAGAAVAGAAGRCLSKEAAALLDGQEEVARALQEAEDSEVAARAGGRKRASRRATIAPSRYGEFLSWDNVKTTPGKGLLKADADDGDKDYDKDNDKGGGAEAGGGGGDAGDADERDDAGDENGDDDDYDDHTRHNTHHNTRGGGGGGSAGKATTGAGRACGMGNGDNGMTCPIPSLRFAPAAADPTVRAVHDKVSALMQMADDLLPPGEDEEDERGGGKKTGGKKGAKVGLYKFANPVDP